MRRIISFSFILLLLGLSYILSGCSQKVQPENILAEFDDQVVTLEEFNKEVSELSDREKSKYKGKEGLEEYLNLMAESRMLLATAIEDGLDKDKEILKQIQEYRDQLLVKELVKREVDDKVDVTEADMMIYYDAHKDDYVEPDKIVVTEITVKDEEKAKEIMEKIKNGADFTKLAAEMDAKGESFGPGQGNEGKTRPFSANSFRNAQTFVDAAFALKVNQISDIIVQPYGNDTLYMIARLDEKIPSRQKEFSEVEKRIKRLVQKEEKKEQMDKWLGALKVKNKFQTYPDRIPEPPAEETKEAESGTTEETKAETGTTEETKAETGTTEEATEKTDKQKAAGEAVEEESEK